MEAVGNNRNMLIPWYLLASYAYYVLDVGLVSDATFDAICIMLDEEWDDVEHMHKWWINRDDLSAGTRISTSYPALVKGAACALAGVRYDPPKLLQFELNFLGEALENLTEAVHDLRIA